MIDPTKTQLSQIGKPIKITVKVAELFNAAYPPADDEAIINFTMLEGGNGGGFGEPKSNFITDIKRNDVILWNIEFEDSKENRDYRLKLICIVQKRGNTADFFDFHPLLPLKRTIIANARHGKPDDLYHYDIIFTISDKFGNSKTYVIDPQLRMHM